MVDLWQFNRDVCYVFPMVRIACASHSPLGLFRHSSSWWLGRRSTLFAKLFRKTRLDDFFDQSLEWAKEDILVFSELSSARPLVQASWHLKDVLTSIEKCREANSRERKKEVTRFSSDLDEILSWPKKLRRVTGWVCRSESKANEDFWSIGAFAHFWNRFMKLLGSARKCHLWHQTYLL